MEEFVRLVTSAQGLALIIPGIVFGLTVILVIKRLIPFVITLILLGFALLSGLAIVNHEAVGDYFRGNTGQSSERYDELKDAFIDLKDQMIESINEFKDKVVDDEEVDDLQSRTQRLELRLNEQEARFQSFMSETRETMAELQVDRSHKGQVADVK